MASDIDHVNCDLDEYTVEKETPEKYVNDAKHRAWCDYTYPADYSVQGHTLVRAYENKDGETEYAVVSRTPFILCSRTEQLEDGNVYWTVRYKAGNIGNVQKEFTVTQTDLLTNRNMQKVLTGNGINLADNKMIHEANDYISLCIHSYGHKLKVEKAVNRNGWNENNTCFAIGKTGICENGIHQITTLVKGEKHLTALRQVGTVEGWVNAVTPLMKYDITRYMFYDAMRAPLIKLLNMESGTNVHHGPTSLGKTTIENIISSAIGDPKELCIPGHSTRVAILAHVEGMCDMPILVDEVTTEKERQIASEIIYDVANGSKKGRGTIAGKYADDSKPFRTVVHITAEHGLREMLTNAGAQIRAREETETLPNGLGEIVHNTNEGIQRNFGYFMPLYISKIFEYKECLEEMYQQACEDIKIDYSTVTTENARMLDRIKYIFAGNVVAGILCEEVFRDIGIPEKSNKEIINIMNKHFAECAGTPIELEYVRALRYFADYVTAEKYRKFCVSDEGLRINGVSTDAYPEHDKCVGNITETYIEIIGTEFMKMMKAENYSASTVKSDLIKNGIAVYKNIYVNKSDIKGMVINRKKMNEKIGYTDITGSEAKDTQTAMLYYHITKFIGMMTEIDRAADKSLLDTVFQMDVTDYLKTLVTESKISIRPNGKYVTV